MHINGSDLEKYRQEHPLFALNQFYRAFNQADINLMNQNWLLDGEVVMANPLGGIKRGWTEIASVYGRIFGGPAKVYVEFYDYALEQVNGMFWVSGRERGHCILNGEELPLSIRTSRVFIWQGDRWRQQLHHGSIDQGDALARYQQFVLN